jgi:Protein of unknown function (DUF3237)
VALPDVVPPGRPRLDLTARPGPRHESAHRASVGYGDQYFFTNPRLETGDERYKWVNQAQFPGQGRLVPGPTVEYRVYRVEND